MTGGWVMKNSTNYKGIHPQIVSAAYSTARKIVHDLRLPLDELDDIMQELVIGGVKAERLYSEDTVAFSTHIFGRIGWLGLDIMRRYNSNKKLVYLRKVDLTNDVRGITNDDALNEQPDARSEREIIAHAEVSLLMSRLMPHEREILVYMRDGYSVDEVADILGYKPWKVREIWDQIRETAKK